MLPRSRQVFATFAVTAAARRWSRRPRRDELVRHRPPKSTSTAPAAAMDSYAATTSNGDCPNMGGDSTPSTNPSTTPSTTPSSSGSSTSISTSTDGRRSSTLCPRSPPAGTARPRGAARLPLPLVRAAPRPSRPAPAALALLAPPAVAGERAKPPTAARVAVAIGQGLQGPAGMKATVYATGLRNVSAFAFDASGRLWATTSAASDHCHDGVYVIPRAGGTPVKVISGVKGPLGLLWHGGRLYVTSLGRVDVFSDLRGLRFAKRKAVIVRAGRPRLEQRDRRDCPAEAGDGHLGRLRPLRQPFALVGDDRLLPSGRQRRARLRRRDPRTLRRRLRQGERGAAHVHEPARRSGREDAGRLAGARPRGQYWRFPGCYGQGGSVCRGVPAPLAVLDKHAAAGGVAIVCGQLGSAVGHVALVTEWERGVSSACLCTARQRLRECAGGGAHHRLQEPAAARSRV